MTRSRVLITGFGPFPGVNDNVSGWLAERLAGVAGPESHAEVLPTAWQAVAVRAPRLLREMKPRLVLHLGLSQRSRLFRIERSAHNRVAARQDARGALPAAHMVLADGPARVDTRLPAAAVARHLRSHDLPALASSSAGSYLCNFLYYLSLDWARRHDRACDVCFVHVPPASKLSESELLRGGELILGYLLDHIERKESAPARAPLATSRFTPLPDPPPQRVRGIDAPSAK